MQARQLGYLIAIDEAGSISKAASGLGMSQPALSAALIRIEQSVGNRLFIRAGGGVRPSAAGSILIEQAKLVLAQSKELDRLANDLAVGRAGRINIGFITSSLYEIMPIALAKFRMHHAGITIVLNEMSSDSQCKALQDGQIDVGICRSPLPSRRGLREKILSSVPFVAAVPTKFKCEADGSIPLRRIVEHGLILPTETAGGLQARILHAIKKSGLRPKVVQEANRGQTMLACVAAGFGVALLPQSIVTTSFRGVRFCRIKPDALPKQDISVIWRASSRPQIADRFVAMLSPRDFSRRS